MYALLQLIDTVIHIYTWIIILYVILSWLIAFNVVNTRNRFVYAVADALFRLTDPVLRPIRRMIPAVGGFDLSPIVVILLLFFIRNLIIVDIGRNLL